MLVLSQATIYVDRSSVFPSENGTMSQPFKTITSAVNNATAGDKIRIKSGIYLEPLVISKLLTFSAYDGDALITPAAPPRTGNHLQQNQKVLVLCVKFKDKDDTRLPSAQAWVDLLNDQVGEYFKKATYDKTTFIFETINYGPPDGWIPIDWNVGDSFFVSNGVPELVLEAAEPYINLAPYHYVIIISNSSAHFGQNTIAFNWYEVSSGIQRLNAATGKGERALNISLAHEWMAGIDFSLFDAGASNIAHELGHAVGLRTHYDNSRFYQWGIMHNPQNPPPHFIGWAKYERSWISPSNVTRVPVPTSQTIEQTIVLKTHSKALDNGTHLIMIPFSLISHFHGYVVEYRIEGNKDWIPQDGVLIYELDERPGDQFARIQVIDDPDSPVSQVGEDTALQLAAYEAGDVFIDNSKKITIEVLETNSQYARVKVIYRL